MKICEHLWKSVEICGLYNIIKHGQSQELDDQRPVAPCGKLWRNAVTPIQHLESQYWKPSLGKGLLFLCPRADRNNTNERNPTNETDSEGLMRQIQDMWHGLHFPKYHFVFSDGSPIVPVLLEFHIFV